MMIGNKKEEDEGVYTIFIFILTGSREESTNFGSLKKRF